MDDKTTRAVRAQLTAMGVDRFEVGILHAPTGKMLLRPWGQAGVEKAVPWLKRQNARGHDIYLRPEGSRGIVLVDDLTDNALARMRRDGCAPAVVVETSPHNFQAWVRIAAEPIAPALATEVGRELATRYGADMNSAHWRHMGRAAGFTNRKPKHRRPDGLQPFVRLLDAPGTVAPAARALLQAAEDRAAARAQSEAHEQALLAAGRCCVATSGAMFSGPPDGAVSRLGDEYRQRMARLLRYYPAGDLSRLDWMVLKDLARAHPDASQQALMRAMWEGSPRLAERKAGHADDYILRTTTKVLHDPDVQQAAHCAPAGAAGRDRRWRCTERGSRS